MANSGRTGYAGAARRGLKDPRLHDDDISPSMPNVSPGKLWRDPDFGPHVAIPDQKTAEGLEWKRPRKISDHPQLFTNGATRFDIGQGDIGTCWFLSIVASIAQDDKLLKEVILKDAYPIGTEAYKGVFHARFWRFGQWEDVYVDDRLPVYKGSKQLWGAHSSSDPNEFWVALLEKAFAKCHGSYDAVDGGYPSDAYLAMTGGVAEILDYDKSDVDRAQKTFHRITNALKSGALVVAEVPEKFNNTSGLKGPHAYSVTKTAVVHAKGKKVSLLRILNPWGRVEESEDSEESEKSEWTGRWSDKSREWEGVSNSKALRTVDNEGEFWMCSKDFMHYFYHTTVCSLTPDFDQDGVPDSLGLIREGCRGEIKTPVSADGH